MSAQVEQPTLFDLEGDTSSQKPVPVSDERIAAIADAGTRRNEALGYDPNVPGSEDYGRTPVVTKVARELGPAAVLAPDVQAGLTAFREQAEADRIAGKIRPREVVDADPGAWMATPKYLHRRGGPFTSRSN